MLRVKLHPDAQRIMSLHLIEARREDAISVADFNACAGVVDRMCRDGLQAHAEHHALAVRTRLGKPWSLRALRLWREEVRRTRWPITA